jgi:hypothetical protein
MDRTPAICQRNPDSFGRRRHTEEVVDKDDPRHSLFSLNRREDFGRVLESDRSFSERVTDGEQVNEKYDGSDLRRLASRFIEERQSCGEQEDAHSGEGDQTELSATNSVDEEKRGDGEDDLDGSVAQRGVQRLCRCVTGVDEDGRRVEGNDCN